MCNVLLTALKYYLYARKKTSLSLLFPLWAKSFGQFSSLAHYPLSLGFNPKNHFGVGLTIHYTVLDLFKPILLFFEINHSLLNFLLRVCLTFLTNIFSRKIKLMMIKILFFLPHTLSRKSIRPFADFRSKMDI